MLKNKKTNFLNFIYKENFNELDFVVFLENVYIAEKKSRALLCIFNRCSSSTPWLKNFFKSLIDFGLNVQLKWSNQVGPKLIDGIFNRDASAETIDPKDIQNSDSEISR